MFCRRCGMSGWMAMHSEVNNHLGTSPAQIYEAALKRSPRVRVQGVEAAGNELDFVATGWFARCMQHEFDHLNGKLYVDRLDEKWGKKARKAVKANGWGKPGNTWLPGTDVDPFGHDEVDEDVDDLGVDDDAAGVDAR